MDTKILLLLVEDELLIRLDIEDALTSAGFNVTAASNGHEAIEQLEARVEEIRGLVTDIRLGNGPTGWDAARRARELVPGLPVVYVSGDSAPDWAAQGVPNSIMVPKPFVTAQIITAVTMLLNEVPVRPAGA